MLTLLAIGAGIAVFAGLGAGIGIGIATSKATAAVARQPEADGKVSKLLLLGSALAEATAIYGFVVGLLIILLLNPDTSPTIIALGAGVAVFTGAGAGIGIGLATSKACESVAKCPSADGKISKILLLGSALAEATAIYGFVVGLLIILLLGDATVTPAIAVGAGVAVFTGIGAGLGIGLATSSACEAVAKCPEADGKISKLLLLGSALAEATAIYGFVIGLLIILLLGDGEFTPVIALGAGVAVLSGVGAGLGIGFATAKACMAVAYNPETDSKISKLLLLGAALSEATAIYGFVVALLIILLLDPATDMAYVAVGAGTAVFTGVGAGFGIGFATSKACEAVAKQSDADSKISKLLLLGSALAEATAIYGFVVGLLIILLLGNSDVTPTIAFGSGVAVFTGIGAGIGIGIATAKSCTAVGRCPEADGKVSKLLLLGSALAEATAIYGFVVGLLIILLLGNGEYSSMLSFGAGLAVFAGVGAGVGIGVATSKACSSVSHNPNADGKISKLLLLGSALSEATAIYGFVVGLLIILLLDPATVTATVAIGAGIAVFTGLGAGFGIGYASSKACISAARQPEADGKISKLLLLGSALAEATAIYGFVIGLLVILLM
jgi:F-type H+-transporting ATPase subunit c